MAKRRVLSTMARDAKILAARRAGVSTRDLAAQYGIGWRAIQLACLRARQEEATRLYQGPERGPKLEPLFPVTTFTPQSECPHHVPIRKGSAFVCMICHAAGLDDHPAVRRPVNLPAPEPTVKPPTPSKTRKQRRARSEAA